MTRLGFCFAAEEVLVDVVVGRGGEGGATCLICSGNYSLLVL